MKKKIICVGAILTSGFFFAQQEKLIDTVSIASKKPQQLHRTGKNVTLVTSRDLEKFQGQELTDVINQVSGVQITGDFNNSPEPKTLRIRGGKLANVLILVDGVPLKDVSGNDYTAADLRLMSLETIDSIEMLNGASSVLYGSNATVSVINLRTKQSARKAVEGEIGMRGGSFDTYAQNASVRGSANGFSYGVSGFNDKSEGISAAVGDKTFDKDGFEKQNLNAFVGYGNSQFGVKVNGGWNHHLYKYDTGAFTDGLQRGNDRQYLVGGNAWWNYTPNAKLSFNTRYTNSRRLAQELASEAYQDQYLYKGDNFFAELLTTNSITDFLDVVGGIQYEKQSMASQQKPLDSNTLEDVLKFDDTNVTTWDVFANANLHFSSFHLDAGGRMTHHSKFKEHFVYSINPYYLQEFGDKYFKAGISYATAFIAPTLYQNFGSLPYTVANFDLKPETNQTYELDLSYGKTDRSMVLNASLFQRDEKDVFAYEVLPDYTGRFVNVEKNKVKGLEAGFEVAPVAMLRLGANYTFVEKDKEATMLRQPKHRVNSFLQINPWKSTQLVLSQQFVSRRSDVYWDASYNRQDVMLPDYTVFNLNVSQKIQDRIEFYGNVGNLFNRKYTDVVGFTTRPRNYTIGFNYKF